MSNKKKLLLFLLAAALCSAGGLAVALVLSELISAAISAITGNVISEKTELIENIIALPLFLILLNVPALLPAIVYNIFCNKFEFTDDKGKTKLFQWLIWAAMCTFVACIMASSEKLMSLYFPKAYPEDDTPVKALFFFIFLFFIASIILTAVINAIINRKKSNFKEKNDV